MSIKEQISEVEKKWFAVQCKWRCEKTLKIDLLDQDVHAYVPMQRKVTQYSSRKKVSDVVLIPSHVFVYICRDQYMTVLEHRHVFRFLNFSGYITTIPEAEMDLLRRVVGDAENIKLNADDYSIGDKVQIIGGELTGLQGELVENKNHNFKISLQSLGIGLSIYVEPKHLMKIECTPQVA